MLSASLNYTGFLILEIARAFTIYSHNLSICLQLGNSHAFKEVTMGILELPVILCCKIPVWPFYCCELGFNFVQSSDQKYIWIWMYVLQISYFLVFGIFQFCLLFQLNFFLSLSSGKYTTVVHICSRKEVGFERNWRMMMHTTIWKILVSWQWQIISFWL